jgi:hypothetical protein
MLDDGQRYLFDLQGWITVPGALDAGQLEELNAEFDRRIAADVGPDENTHRFGDILDWGPAWSQASSRRSWDPASASTTTTPT